MMLCLLLHMETAENKGEYAKCSATAQHKMHSAKTRGAQDYMLLGEQ